VLDARGRVWIGTSDAGIDILEPATGRIEHLRHDATIRTLDQRPDPDLTFDRSGTLWAGTKQGSTGCPASPPGAFRDSSAALRLQPAQRHSHIIPTRKAIPALERHEVNGSSRIETALCGWARVDGGSIAWTATAGSGELPSQPT